MIRFHRLCAIGVVFLAIAFVAGSQSQTPAPKKGDATAAPSKSSSNNRPDIVVAVKAAAKKDCGCGACAAKGCDPCHGKNCYYCAAKSLVAKDCGCKGCDAKGCGTCGPGCDVCKFHLAPNAEAKKSPQPPAK